MCPDLLSMDVISNDIATRGITIFMVKVGSTYYAIKYDGTIISSSTTAETVIQAAINNSGTIYFPNHNTDATNFTNWDLSAGFTGFTITQYVEIISDKQVFIGVPQGFSGICFKVGGTGANPSDRVSMRGLSFYEQGTPSKLWTAIKLEIANGGAGFNEIYENILIYDANIGFELETAGTGFMTNCTFRNIDIENSNTAFLFDEQNPGGTGISENRFQNVIVEANGAATDGFKNVSGTGNVFINCNVWDQAASGVEMNITADGDGIQIIGGKLTGSTGHFIDQGFKTLIIDSGQTVTSRLRTNPDLAKIGTWDGVTTTAGEGILNSRLAAITVGRGTNSGGADSTGIYRTFDTAGTINSLAGIRCDTRQVTRINNCYFKTAIYLNSVTNVRIFAGLVASASAPASSADPLNALEGVALWLDSAVSANWKRMHNDNTGASTVDDTTIVAATSTLYPVEIYAVGDSKFRLVALGQSTDISTNIPASTTTLAFWIYIENTTAASRTMRSYYAILKSDK